MNRFIQLIPGFKRLREKLVGEQDPTLFRMAKTWASELQPGLVSPQALFGSSHCCTVSNGSLFIFLKNYV